MLRDLTPKPTDGREPDPAVASQPVCPNCGHRPAVVFPALADGLAAGQPKLVCLLCCPERTDHS